MASWVLQCCSVSLSCISCLHSPSPQLVLMKFTSLDNSWITPYVQDTLLSGVFFSPEPWVKGINRNFCKCCGSISFSPLPSSLTQSLPFTLPPMGFLITYISFPSISAHSLSFFHPIIVFSCCLAPALWPKL